MPKTFAFVLDFTFDGKKVFALEMGDLFKSGLSGLDRLRKEKNQIPLHDEYHNILRQRYPTAIYLDDESTPWSTRIGLYDFAKDVKTSCNFKGYELIPNLLYSRALLGVDSCFDRPLIATFQSNGFAPWFRSSLAKLQKKQQNTFDILNYPSGVLIDACQDKVVFHRFTAKTDFCPATLLVDLETLNHSEIKTFISQNMSSHYVIKPTNMSLGRGVTIVKSDELIEFINQLQQLSLKQTKSKHSSNNNSKEIAVWKEIILERKNPFLLLQTCCPSKEINHEAKVYRPTGRAVIEAVFAEDSSLLPSLNFLGSYWKFPLEISDSYQTSSLVSNVDDNNPIAAIEPDDWQKIQAQLQTYLPQILNDLFSTEFDELSSHFENSSAVKHYQKILGIDEESQLNHQDLFLPKSKEASSSFDKFTYGGPGFKEYLTHFRQAICMPNPSLIEIAEQKINVSNFENHTFFANELKGKTELIAQDPIVVVDKPPEPKEEAIETDPSSWCQLL